MSVVIKLPNGNWVHSAAVEGIVVAKWQWAGSTDAWCLYVHTSGGWELLAGTYESEDDARRDADRIGEAMGHDYK